MSNSRRAFTLIEMRIVVAVIATLSLAALPRAEIVMTHTRVNKAAAVVAGDFEFAGSLAGRQQRPVRMTFDPTAMAYSLTDRTNGAQLLYRPLGAQSDFRIASLTS